jgi:hypothetical protein
MTGLIAVVFGVIFFIMGAIVGAGIGAWIAYSIGFNNCEKRYGKKSDFKTKEVVTIEKKDGK